MTDMTDSLIILSQFCFIGSCDAKDNMIRYYGRHQLKRMHQS
jgi:hypothetical protein